MNQAEAMQVGDGGGQRGDEAGDVVDRQRRALGEGRSVDESGDELGVGLSAQLDQLDDSGMAGPSQQLRLTARRSAGPRLANTPRSGLAARSTNLKEISIQYFK